MSKRAFCSSVITCAAGITGIRNALYVLNGKWKLPLIFELTGRPMRFKDIQRSLGEITPKILSKELKELELNEFVVRNIYHTIPIKVTYELTAYSMSLTRYCLSLKHGVYSTVSISCQ